MDAPSDLGSPGPALSPPPPEGREPRRLQRRPDDGHIAGVCAGIAEYFNLDPLIVRIAAVILLVSGPGALAYVLAWIFVPAAPGPSRFGEPRTPIDRKDRATQIFGVILLGLGLSVIWGDWWAPARGWLFPLGLVALGGWLLLRPDRDDDAAGAAGPAPAQPWTDATTTQGRPIDPADAPDPTTTDTPSSSPPMATAPSGDGGGWGPPPAPWDVPPSPVSGGDGHQGSTRVRHHRHRHMVGPGVFGVLLVWAGVAWLTGVGLTTGLAVGLVILGIGFVVGSFVGGSRVLILPAILLAAALGVAALVDIPLSGPVGEQQWSPTRLSELDDLYEVSMGKGTLDLSGLPLVRQETTVRATVGLGHLVVLVPQDQDVFVNTDVAGGEVTVFGERQEGVGFETHDGFPGDGGTLVLDLEVGFGEIEVIRAGSDALS